MKKEAEISRDEARDLKEIFKIDSKEETKDVKISFDKSQEQYTVRIPKNFARELKIDSSKHVFRFKLTNKDGSKHLDSTLIKDESEKENN